MKKGENYGLKKYIKFFESIYKNGKSYSMHLILK